MYSAKVKNYTIPPRKKRFLLEYKKEISKISKYLPQKINETLLKESQMYPLQTIDCMERANELLNSKRVRNTSILVGIKNTDELVNEIVKSPKDFLLLLSYCSKPTHCPSGRFSEKCQPTNNSVCNGCPFKEIILKAKRINCQCLIVTQDHLMFTRHLIPRFRNFRKSGKYYPLIATGCSLAIKRFYRAAVILGSIGIVYKFISGFCRDSQDYQKAEAGKKTKVTKLSQRDWQEINYILDEVIKRIKH